MSQPPEKLPYAVESLDLKGDIGADQFFALDMRVGRVVDVEDFPEARKPAWKLAVDFGPVIGTLRTSAQITNYSKEELMGRLVVGAVNLALERARETAEAEMARVTGGLQLPPGTFGA